MNEKLILRLVQLLAVLLLMVLVYLPCLPADPFSTDDQRLIQIPQITEFRSFRDLRSFFLPGEHVDYYPVRDLSYLADHLLWPDSLTLARLHQLFFLWGAGVSFILLLSAMGLPWSFALLAGGAWILHPYHAETAVWLSARKDVLGLFWGLAAACAFAWGWRLRRRWLYWAALGCFVLSLLSKASFGLLPAAFLVSLAWSQTALPKKTLPIIATAVGLGLVSSFFQSWFYSTVNDMRLFAPWTLRAEVSLAALGRMAAGWVWPAVNAVDGENFGNWLALNSGYLPFGVLVLMVAGGCLFRGLKTRRFELLFGSLAFFALYAPISGLLFPHRSLYSTRYFEPSSLAALGLLVFLLRPSWNRFVRGRLKGRAPFLGAGVLLLIVAAWSSYEASNWHDTLAIREKAWRLAPDHLATKTFLWADLRNLIQRGRATSEDRTLYDDLTEQLGRSCPREGFPSLSLRSPELNCFAFFRHQLSLAQWSGKTEEEEIDRHLLLKTQEVLSPRPRIVERLRFEKALREGLTPSEEVLRPWVDGRFYPHEDYRVLHLIALCLDRREEEAGTYGRFVQDFNLLRKEALRELLSEKAAPPLLERIKTCLNVSS